MLHKLQTFQFLRIRYPLFFLVVLFTVRLHQAQGYELGNAYEVTLLLPGSISCGCGSGPEIYSPSDFPATLTLNTGFTMFAWYKPTTFSTGAFPMTMIDSYDSPMMPIAFVSIDSGAGNNYLAGSGQDTITTGAVVDEWVFLYVSYDTDGSADVRGIFIYQAGTAQPVSVSLPQHGGIFIPDFTIPNGPERLLLGAGFDGSAILTQGCGQIARVGLMNMATDDLYVATAYSAAGPGSLEIHLAMREGAGQYLFDSSGRYTPVTIGTDPNEPTWTSTKTLAFTGNTFINLPTLSYTHNTDNLNSVVLVFWIKVTSTSDPCGPAPYIYRRSTGTTTNFGVYVKVTANPATQISLQFANGVLDFPFGPTVGQWQMIGVICSSNPYPEITPMVRCSVSINAIGISPLRELLISTTDTLVGLTGTKDTIGDSTCSFAGEIQDFRVYVDSTALFPGTDDDGIGVDADDVHMMFGLGSSHIIVSNSTFSNPCPSGLKEDSDVGACFLPCEGGCTTCNSAGDICFTCPTLPSPTYMYDNACVGSCPGGLLPNGGVCTNCPAGTYPPNCLPCYSNCATCTGGGYDECTSCTSVSLYFLEQNICKNLTTFALFPSNKINRFIFHLNQPYPSLQTLLLSYTTMTINDVVVGKNEYIFNIFNATTAEITITLVDNSITYDSLTVQISSPSDLYYIPASSASVKVAMNSGTLSPAAAQAISIAATTSIVGGIAMSFTGVMNMINNAGSGSLGRGAYICELVQFIQFINVEFPMNVQVYFESTPNTPAPTNFNWNAIQQFSSGVKMANMNRVTMYGKFEEYGMYHYFNTNYGAQLTTNIVFCILALITWGLSKLRSKISTRSIRWSYIILKLDNFMRWNFVFDAILPSYLPLVMFACLQYLFTYSPLGYDLFGTITATVCLLLSTVLVVSIIRFLVGFAKGKKNEEDFPHIASLYDSYKKDSLWQLLFYPIILIRAVILGFVLAFLQNYPFVQATIVMVLQGLFLVYFYWQMPLLYMREKILQAIGDTISFILCVACFVYAVMDYMEYTDDTVRSGIGNIIIYGCMSVVVCIAIFFLLEFFEGLRELYRWLKRARATEKKLKESLIFMDPSESTIKLTKAQKETLQLNFPGLISIPENPENPENPEDPSNLNSSPRETISPVIQGLFAQKIRKLIPSDEKLDDVNLINDKDATKSNPETARGDAPTARIQFDKAAVEDALLAPNRGFSRILSRVMTTKKIHISPESNSPGRQDNQTSNLSMESRDRGQFVPLSSQGGTPRNNNDPDGGTARRLDTNELNFSYAKESPRTETRIGLLIRSRMTAASESTQSEEPTGTPANILTRNQERNKTQSYSPSPTLSKSNSNSEFGIAEGKDEIQDHSYEKSKIAAALTKRSRFGTLNTTVGMSTTGRFSTKELIIEDLTSKPDTQSENTEHISAFMKRKTMREQAALQSKATITSSPLQLRSSHS